MIPTTSETIATGVQLGLLIASGSIPGGLIATWHFASGDRRAATHEWRYTTGGRHASATQREVYDHVRGKGASERLSSTINRIAFSTGVVFVVASIVLPSWYLGSIGGSAWAIAGTAVISLLASLATIWITLLLSGILQHPATQLGIVTVWGALLVLAARTDRVARFLAWITP